MQNYNYCLTFTCFQKETHLFTYITHHNITLCSVLKSFSFSPQCCYATHTVLHRVILESTSLLMYPPKAPSDLWRALACEQLTSTVLTPLWRGETEERRGGGGRQSKTAGEEGKRPERSVKPPGESWESGQHNDVIRIDSRGEQILTVLNNCYHSTDSKRVGGLFTLQVRLTSGIMPRLISSLRFNFMYLIF